MQIFTGNIRQLALDNTNFRKVLVTGGHSQLVLMSLLPGEDIGNEVHEVDQILLFVLGNGKAILNETEYPIAVDTVFFVPANTYHNFINEGETAMKLISVYAPSEHQDGTIHNTKSQSEEAESASIELDEIG